MWGAKNYWERNDPDFSDAYGGMGDYSAPAAAAPAASGGGMPAAGLMASLMGGNKSEGAGPDGVPKPPSATRSVGADALTGASVGGPWGAAIGAGVGLLKNSSDQAHYKQQVLQAANTDRLSYITGRKGQMPTYQSSWNNPMALAATGAAYGQARDTAATQSQLQKAYLDRMNAGTAAINDGRMPASMGMAGLQKPSSKVSDSIWDSQPTMDNRDQNNMAPSMYDYYRTGV